MSSCPVSLCEQVQIALDERELPLPSHLKEHVRLCKECEFAAQLSTGRSSPLGPLPGVMVGAFSAVATAAPPLRVKNSDNELMDASPYATDATSLRLTIVNTWSLLPQFRESPKTQAKSWG